MNRLLVQAGHKMEEDRRKEEGEEGEEAVPRRRVVIGDAADRCPARHRADSDAAPVASLSEL